MVVGCDAALVVVLVLVVIMVLFAAWWCDGGVVGGVAGCGDGLSGQGDAAGGCVGVFVVVDFQSEGFEQGAGEVFG